MAGTDALGSARAPAERRTRGEQTRPHTQARAERRRHVAEEISAGRAAAVVRDRTSNIRPQPVAAGFAQRIDALHRQAGQVLHRFTSSTAKRPPWRGRARAITGRAPGCPPRSRRRTLRARVRCRWSRTGDRAGTAHSMAHSALSHLWCQAENTARYCGEVAAVKNVVRPA